MCVCVCVCDKELQELLTQRCICQYTHKTEYATTVFYQCTEYGHDKLSSESVVKINSIMFLDTKLLNVAYACS